MNMSAITIKQDTICCIAIDLISTMAMQMRHYEETEDGVTLHFDKGQPLVHAKVLVGADGYFSRVRTQCLNDGPPTFNVSTILQY